MISKHWLILLLLAFGIAFTGPISHCAVSGCPSGNKIAVAKNLPTISESLATDDDGQIGVIILFAREPLATYRTLSLGNGTRLSAREEALIRARQNKLRLEHARFISDARAAGIRLTVNHDYTYLINGLALTIRTTDLEQLLSMPVVEAVYADSEVFLPPQAAVQPATKSIMGSTPESEGMQGAGAGIRVAIVDTGIDYTHPDLGGCFGSGCKVAGGYDLYNDDADPRDDNGHGTHCAGIAAADGAVQGVAPGASLLAYKVLDANGVGSMSTVIAGIERAADPDQDPATADAVEIISLSIGLPGTPDDPWSLAVDAAVASGVTVIASAGNYGPEYGQLGSPGIARKAISVGATDGDAIAEFSSRGPAPGFDRLSKPQIVAPGVAISSTWLAGDYATLSGTSMAAPYAAGAAALIKQANPAWTPDMIQSGLLNNAQNLSLDIYTQGAGKVNLAGLLDASFLVSPGLISLGTVDPTQPQWTASEILKIHNLTAEKQTYVIATSETSPGLRFVLDPESIALGAGEVGYIALSATVDTAVARPDLGSNQSRILVQSGNDRIAVPFSLRLPDLFSESLVLPYAAQSSFGLALGDLDGDGDSDAFMANASFYNAPGNTVWRNSGEGLFSDSGQRLGDSFSRAVELGDLDGDGDLDAFVANSDVDNALPDRVWLNDGDGAFFQTAQDIGYTHSRDVKLGDLDGDGDLDAFVVSSYFSHGTGEPSKVWMNNGKGFFTDSGQNLGNALSQAVALGDFDGDGDLDAFVANGSADREFGRPNTVWINNGSGQFTSSGQLLGNSISQDVAVGDLDSDGDLDVFVANGGVSAGDAQPDVIWLNNGAAFFADSGQRLGSASSMGVALNDFHGDGHLDAFVARYRQGNQVWINDGRGEMQPSSPAFGIESGVDIASGDVDNDGDADALVASALGRPNRLWLNRGSGSATSGHIRVISNRGDAPWRITGPANLVGKASSTLYGVLAGTYRIEWGSIPSCTSPESQSSTLLGGETITLTGAYGNCMLSAPEIISPGHGAYTNAAPTLNWHEVAFADGYHVQIDNHDDFNNPLTDEIVSETTFNVTGTLSAGSYQWRVRTSSSLGYSEWSTVHTFVVAGVASVPFSEDFEAGEMHVPWHVTTTVDGRVQLSEDAAYSGSSGMLLDDERADYNYSTAAADFMIDVEGCATCILSFVWRNWRQVVQHGLSGVFVSSDYGRSWHKILAFDEQTPLFKRESIALANAAAVHDLDLNDHFLIRFQILEDDPFSVGGGLAVDALIVVSGPRGPTNLTVTAVSHSGIQLDWQDNADDESAYLVERQVGDDAPFSELKSLPVNCRSYFDAGLLCGTSYGYRVRAYRAADGSYSIYSDTAFAATADCGFLGYLPFLAAKTTSME